MHVKGIDFLSKFLEINAYALPLTFLDGIGFPNIDTHIISRKLDLPPPFLAEIRFVFPFRISKSNQFLVL